MVLLYCFSQLLLVFLPLGQQYAAIVGEFPAILFRCNQIMRERHNMSASAHCPQSSPSPATTERERAGERVSLSRQPVRGYLQ